MQVREATLLVVVGTAALVVPVGVPVRAALVVVGGGGGGAALVVPGGPQVRTELL